MTRKTDRPAGATYRCDWMTKDAGPTADINVTFHEGNLPNARQQARRMSKKHGAAYVIETVAGKDNAQLAYTDGSVDGGTHNWETR